VNPRLTPPLNPYTKPENKMKKTRNFTLTALLALASWIPSTAQSAPAAELQDCKRLTVELDHELARAYNQLTDSTRALRGMREALPSLEKEAERRGWKRGTGDAWGVALPVGGGAAVGSFFGPVGALIGGGVGAAYGGIRALVRKWSGSGGRDFPK
jgi:hypothetical protein